MTISRHLETLIVTVLTGLPAALPLPLARTVGAALGDVARRLDGRHRRVAHRSLDAAFPDMSTAVKSVIIRRCFRHFGSVVADFFHLGRLTPVALCRRLEFENWSLFGEAEAAGRGVLILTAHLGFHELLAPVVALYKGPMHLVARPLRNLALNTRVNGIRSRFGNRLVPKRGAARGLLQAISSGGRAAILIDQRVHPNEGIEVPFFGRPSWTSPLPARISIRTGAPVLPLFAFPLAGGTYRLLAHEPIFPDGSSEDVGELTTRYLAVIEKEIRARPPQWLWMHDRWRRH